MKKILLAVLFVFSSVNAQDLGVIGTSYDIVEPDLLEVIYERLNQRLQDGGLAKLNSARGKSIARYLERPPGVKLAQAKTKTIVRIDPTYTLAQDIVDADGEILFMKGTTYNPLDYMPFNRILCFIDGDSPKQLQWVGNHCLNRDKTHIVLVNGSYTKVSKALGVRVYFDQSARLTQLFKLTALPAQIRQEGRYLHVETFVPD